MKPLISSMADLSMGEVEADDPQGRSVEELLAAKKIRDELYDRLRKEQEAIKAEEVMNRARSTAGLAALSAEDLTLIRKFNDENNVEAPTMDMPPPSTLQLPAGTVLPVASPEEGAAVQDFHGVIDGGGVKDSMFTNYETKPPLGLVPKALLWGVGRALGYGAKKYAANNWRRGMAWNEPASALLRHFMAWLEGEDIDPESGLHHLDSVGANLAFLMHMIADERYKHLDDRP